MGLLGPGDDRRARGPGRAGDAQDDVTQKPERQPQRNCTMTTKADKKSAKAKIFRVTVEVSNLEDAVALYAKLLDDPGKGHPGARHYFDCGGVILALLDPSQGGMKPTPMPKCLYF